jgi:hypothetical protein
MVHAAPKASAIAIRAAPPSADMNCRRPMSIVMRPFPTGVMLAAILGRLPHLKMEVGDLLHNAPWDTFNRQKRKLRIAVRLPPQKINIVSPVAMHTVLPQRVTNNRITPD